MPARRSKHTMAAHADRYALYQQSVQQPDADIAFIDRVFRAYYGHPPRLLREDFCGAGFVSCRWAASHRDRRAWGVDLDPEPLAWGELHNRSTLPDEVQQRVELIEGNVLTAAVPPVEAVVAGNFSFCVFGSRPELREYFQAVHRQLGPEGVFVLDVLGGAETQREHNETVRAELRFDYVWEQRTFDPVSYRAEFAIHFRFPDRSEIRNAFVYDWRLWTLPEIQELLIEAGFSQVDVYWELADARTGTGNGVFRRVNRAPADECWLAEVVAIR